MLRGGGIGPATTGLCPALAGGIDNKVDRKACAAANPIGFLLPEQVRDEPVTRRIRCHDDGVAPMLAGLVDDPLRCMSRAQDVPGGGNTPLP